MSSDKVVSVHSFDGQVIFIEKNVPLYEVGNFLGGGAAGLYNLQFLLVIII